MGLTIFWRIILIQSVLIILILIVSLYSFTRLNRLTQLHTDILTIDATCIQEEKKLLKIFLAQMRNAEKFLLLRDEAFQASVAQGKEDFASTVEKILSLVDTSPDREIVREIKTLHVRYDTELNQALSGKKSSETAMKEVGDGIIQGTNELIRLREQVMGSKTMEARDEAAASAKMIGWLSLGGIVGALLIGYLHARNVSSPLGRLAHEMGRVAKGEFVRCPEFRAPREIGELAQTFNRMSEALARLDQLKADFTAHVSHELRTPLTAIREGTSLLLEGIPGPLTQSQQDILEVVKNHSERLFYSISSILDLSKMEAEMMEYDFTACDLAALVRKSVDTVSLIAEKRRIGLQTDVAGPLPILSLDERRIQQVFDNLLSNALKFTPEGGRIRVSAQVQANGEAGEQVEIRVCDTGAGIAQEDIENVFKRFYRGSHGSGKKQQGTGLGLAISRHIVEAHRGRIWAESAFGKGSTFVFVLPVLPAGNAREESPA